MKCGHGWQIFILGWPLMCLDFIATSVIESRDAQLKYGESMKKRLLFIFILMMSCGHLKEAQKYYDSGNYKATLQACRVAIEKDSTDSAAFMLMGQSFYKLGELDSSLGVFNKFLVLQPEDEKCKEMIFNVHNDLADRHFQNKDYRKARAEYETALGLFPGEPHVVEKIGDTFLAAGRQDKAEEQFQLALAAVGDSLSLNDKIAKIEKLKKEAQKYLHAGIANLKKKRFEKAMSNFSRALEIKPDFEDAKYFNYIATGHKLYKKGSKSALWDAIEQYGLASSLRPQTGAPHYFMGLAYNKKDKNEFDNAIRELDTAVQVEPNGQYAKLAGKKSAELKKRQKLLRDFWGKGK